MRWLSLFLIVGMASAQYCPKIEIDKTSGSCTVPDPALTPGEMDASLACVSNADRPRSVTNSEKDAILRAYGYLRIPTNQQANSTTGIRTGWAGRTGQRTSGSSRMQASSARSPKTKLNFSFGERCA